MTWAVILLNALLSERVASPFEEAVPKAAILERAVAQPMKAVPIDVYSGFRFPC